MVSLRERREADLFFADLMGWSPGSSVGLEEFESVEIDTFESLLDGLEDVPSEDDPACPPPGPIPSSCTRLGLREVIQCFEYDRDRVLPRHQPQIIHIARCILASQGTSTPITTLRLVGHTDVVGDDTHNDNLGMRRARKVKDAIEAALNRISGGRPPRVTITTDTRGRRDLLPGAAALSRRVEVLPPFVFTPTPPASVCPADFQVRPTNVTITAGDSTVFRATDLHSTSAEPVTFTWNSSSARLTLDGAGQSPQTVSGPSLTVRALREGTPPGDPGELITVTRTQTGCASLSKQVRVRIDCRNFVLTQPRVIAIASDRTIRPVTSVTDPAIPGSPTLSFGQDLTFGTGRAQPHGPSQGTTTGALDPIMRRLLGEFASNDTHGKARRLFNDFLAPNRSVRFWSDADLTTAAQAHPNIQSFVSRAFNSPISPERTSGATRIHQALEAVGWDINRATTATGLGVPAFNRGTAWRGTDDFGNGLAVMINGIQHVFVVAREYYFDACARRYFIRLEYVFYDVFGLDDDDLRQFGADGGVVDSAASRGITAWWQLQHQHGYVPLITRISFERTFTVPVP